MRWGGRADVALKPNPPPVPSQVRIGSMHNAFYIVNLTFFLGSLALCAAFAAWRAAHRRKAPVTYLCDDDHSAPSASSKHNTPRWRQSETDEHRVEVAADELLKFLPYRTSPVGMLCYALCCAVSLQFVALYIVILVDYYAACQLRSIDNLCFYGTYFLFGSYDVNGTVFFVVWVLSVIWYTTWVLCKGRVINWFRVPCGLKDANHMYVWAPDHAEVLTQCASPLVLFFRRVKARRKRVGDGRGPARPCGGR